MPQKATLDEQMGLLNQDKARIEFVRSSYNDITAFFQEASRDYDSDLCNPYWAFAHDILKFILAKHITEHFRNTSQIRVFDAGAGTGNWSRFVLTLGTGIRGIMFDMNPCMLKVAVPKLVQARGNTGCVEGDLEVLADFPSQRSNLVLCMHNVIGFGRSTSAILRNLYIYLEPGGLAFVMTTNKYHAFNFTSQLRGRAEALRVVRDSTVKFKPDMPEMFCYTPLCRLVPPTPVGAGYEAVQTIWC
jgi:SAM-dependent methyltransferase